MKIVLNVLATVFFLASGSIFDGGQSYAGSVLTTELKFQGTASGGELILAFAANKMAQYISLQTSKGETAASVANRLAEVINASHTEIAGVDRNVPKPRWNKLWTGSGQAIAKDGSLVVAGGLGMYFLAGTETGLGIPQAPSSLSANPDPKTNMIVLNWEIPESGYDKILVSCISDGSLPEVAAVLGGDSKTVKIDKASFGSSINRILFRVSGIKNGLPSNMSAIELSGNSQAELFGVPFSRGIMPNWKAWSSDGKLDFELFQQGDKYGRINSFNPVDSLMIKPFYQIIKGHQNDVSVGLVRKFIGLTSGKTYRIVAGINTFGMDSAPAPWSFDICAAHNGVEGKDLSYSQLAGNESLPDGSSGPSACRLSHYSGNKGTGSLWELAAKVDDKGKMILPQVTVPPDSNTITVWLRFECQGQGEVGFSGLMLERLDDPNLETIDIMRSKGAVLARISHHL